MKGYTKILFVHDAFGEDSIESAWAKKVKNGYQLENVLFYASNFSYGDIVQIKELAGDLYVTDLVEEKGHSTIRILFQEIAIIPEVRKRLRVLGCSSELSNIAELIAVDIPPEVSYSIIRQYLDQGEEQGKWEYQEACIAAGHR